MSVLVVRVAAFEAEEVSWHLVELGATAIQNLATEDAGDLGSLGQVSLVAGFSSELQALKAREVLSERWPARLEHTGDESAWRDQYLQFLEPVEVAGFLIYPPWKPPHTPTEHSPGHSLSHVPSYSPHTLTTESAATSDAAQPLVIDPGRAFGSGHHPTTGLCLSALRGAVKPGFRVADIGCGTGVLSIAAMFMGARFVLATDCDEAALLTAESNGEANGITEVAKVFATHTGACCAANVGDSELIEAPLQIGSASEGLHLTNLSASELVEAQLDFDVVVCNIVIGDLRPLLGDLLALTRSKLIISGFREDNIGEIKAFFQPAQIEFEVATESQERWARATITTT